jgi:two-component system sensor histidine kinase/response regulator
MNAPADSKARVAASIERAKADLERALVDLDRLPVSDPATIGYIAHALNNYLTVATATVELLQLSLHGEAQPEVTAWLDGLHHLADLMHHTVGKLLPASTPLAFPMKPDLVNVSLLLERACQYYQRIARGRQIDLACGSVGEVPIAWADRVAVAVVADNLLSNAIKFSPSGRSVEVQVLSDPPYVACRIKDQGPGLSLEDQQRLLRSQFPLGSTPRGDHPSTGFGLAIVTDFLGRMGGTLSCQSADGHGACFTFRLPTAR